MNVFAASGLFAAFAAFACVANGAQVVSQIVRQQWPWDGRVRVNYVLDAAAGETYDVSLRVTDPLGNDVTGTLAAQTGDIEFVSAGEHDIWWNPKVAGCEIARETMLKFEVTLGKPSGPKYLVIDLSAGIGGTYTVEQLDRPPEGGFNTNEYKTRKMAFRRCKAGSYFMGSPETEAMRVSPPYEDRNDDSRFLAETRHLVTFTNDFWLALFELTEGQSARIWETNKTCSADSTKVFYGVETPLSFRGPDYTWWNRTDSQVEPNSFFGCFRSSAANCLPAGYTLDLPTEAQWEYACRAGTDTAYSIGVSPSSNDYVRVSDFGSYNPRKSPFYHLAALDSLGQYCANGGVWRQAVQPSTVGRYAPNPWGFYDMYGNCEEFCRDAAVESNGNADLGSAEAVEPLYVWFDSDRMGAIARGGGWLTGAENCRSASRRKGWLPSAAQYTVRPAIVWEVK